MNKNRIVYSEPDSKAQGKSMRFLAEWSPHTEYFNNANVQDFVTYNGILWGCIESCKGHAPCEDCPYWSKAVVGPRGPKGKEIVTMYESKSTFDDLYSYSIITVIYSDGSRNDFELQSVRNKGDRGLPGARGEKGESFKFEDFTEEQLESLKVHGKNGITPLFKIENDYWKISYDNGTTWSQLGVSKGSPGLNGKDGQNGKDGLNGKDGIDGKDGRDGKDGINGIDGKDGKDGIDGRNGIDGLPGKDGVDGKDGLNGKDGRDGVDGKNGINGQDGKDGDTWIPFIDSEGVISWHKGSPTEASPIITDLDKIFISHSEFNDMINLNWIFIE